MPVVTIEMLEGRTDEQKQELITKITNVLVETIHCRKEHVTIVMHEVKPTNYGLGGEALSTGGVGHKL